MSLARLLADLPSSGLDDYEEGTWTPTSSSVGAQASTVANGEGVYTKVGRMVFYASFADITISNITDDFRIGGLPFTVVDQLVGTSVPQSFIAFTSLPTTILLSHPVELSSTVSVLPNRSMHGTPDTVMSYRIHGWYMTGT